MNKIVLENCVVYFNSNPSQQVSISVVIREDNNILQNIESNRCFVLINENNINNLNSIINQVIRTLKERNINVVTNTINLVSMNSEDKVKLQCVQSNAEFKFVISDVQPLENKANVVDSVNEKKEEDPLKEFWNSNVIYKMNNGKLVTYIHRTGGSNSNGYMLEGVQLNDLYNEYVRLRNTTQFSDEIQNLNKEQIANKLLDSIAASRNLKKYYMEDASEVRSNDGNVMENTVTGLAASSDGVANKETGIVYDSSNVNSYKSVEKNGDNLTVVTPNVISNNSTVSSGGDSYEVNSNSFEPSNSDIEYDNVQLGEDQLQSREVQNKYVRKRVLTKSTPNGFVSIVAYVIVAIFVLLFIGIIIFR